MEWTVIKKKLYKILLQDIKLEKIAVVYLIQLMFNWKNLMGKDGMFFAALLKEIVEAIVDIFMIKMEYIYRLFRLLLENVAI